jgi:hypothetical protein
MARIRIDDLPIADSLSPEQEQLILGAGLRSFRPSLEALEDRQLMSAGLTVLPLKPPALAPATVSTPSIQASAQGGAYLQSQLQALIAGQGARVDAQHVGKLVVAAAHREASALWGDTVAAGVCQVALGEITQSDHGVLVKFRLNHVVGGEVKAYRGFEVQIKYDDRGAVTAECNFRQGWGRSFYLPMSQDAPFVQNMNKAIGGPLWVPPTLAEGFL